MACAAVHVVCVVSSLPQFFAHQLIDTHDRATNTTSTLSQLDRDRLATGFMLLLLLLLLLLVFSLSFLFSKNCFLFLSSFFVVLFLFLFFVLLSSAPRLATNTTSTVSQLDQQLIASFEYAVVYHWYVVCLAVILPVPLLVGHTRVVSLGSTPRRPGVRSCRRATANITDSAQESSGETSPQCPGSKYRHVGSSFVRFVRW